MVTNHLSFSCWLDGTALLAFMWIPIILLTIITLAVLVKCYIELNKTAHKHKEMEVEVVKVWNIL